MSAKRGIFVAPFDELVDPNALAELAASAEEHGEAAQVRSASGCGAMQVDLRPFLARRLSPEGLRAFGCHALGSRPKG